MYTLAHAAVAHWLLVNIVFHYYKVGRVLSVCCAVVVVCKQPRGLC
jgi:hypothetical protein